MQRDENYESYIENEGCCAVLIYKLREKRCVVISLLLFAVAVSIVAGLYNGITAKEYNSMTIAVGIWFPGAILIVICIYLAITCVQGSFSSRPISPRIPYLSDESQSGNWEDTTQHPQRNCETRVNLHSKHGPKFNRQPTDTSLRMRAGKAKHKRVCDVTENPASYRGNKMHGRRFRSLSNSDITRYRHRNNKIPRKGSEMRGCNYRTVDDSEYSTRYRWHQDESKFRGSRRSVSDTVFTYGNTESTEKLAVKSLDTPRRYTEKQYSVADEEEQSDEEYFNSAIEEHIRKAQYPVKPLCRYNKASGGYETESTCGNYMDKNRRSIRRRDMCLNKYYAESVRRENVKDLFTKPEISRLYSSNTMEYPCEYRQPLNFSYSLPDRTQHLRENRNVADCSSNGNEENGYLFRSNFKIPSNLPRNEERQKYISPQQKIEIINHVKRKAIYLPSPSSTESTRQLSRHVPEDGRCLPRNSGMAHRPSTRKEEHLEYHSLNDQQSMKHTPIYNHLRSQSVGCLTRNSENNPQEMIHSIMEYPLNKNNLVERQMPSHFQREYPSRDMQVCETSASDCRENVDNHLPSMTQGAYLDINFYTEV